MESQYIRVECIDNTSGESKGGYMCAIMMIMALKLNVSPEIGNEKLLEELSKSNDPELRDLIPLLGTLGDIPQPEGYIEDKKNHVCLYQLSEFYEEVDDLAEVSFILEETSEERYSLCYKRFDIDETEILYEDPFQIVISKETYDEKNNDLDYIDVAFAVEESDEFEDDWDE